MKFASALAGVCLAAIVSAVDMSRYDPQPGVEAGFKSYLKELYNQTEIKDADQTFYDFFYPPGVLGILGKNYTGHEQIIAEKRRLLDPNDNHFWSHFPNKTSVVSESPTTKTYMVLGIINNIYKGEPNNNCSAAYYKSQFTLLKESDGCVDFTPHSANLIYYNDYLVQPSTVPTNIKCAS